MIYYKRVLIPLRVNGLFFLYLLLFMSSVVGDDLPQGRILAATPFRSSVSECHEGSRLSFLLHVISILIESPWEVTFEVFTPRSHITDLFTHSRTFRHTFNMPVHHVDISLFRGPRTFGIFYTPGISWLSRQDLKEKWLQSIILRFLASNVHDRWLRIKLVPGMKFIQFRVN